MHLSQVVIRCERNCYPASFELTDNTGRPLHRVRRCGCQQSQRMSGDQCPTADMNADETSGAGREPQNFNTFHQPHRLQNRPCPLCGHRITPAPQENGPPDHKSVGGRHMHALLSDGFVPGELAGPRRTPGDITQPKCLNHRRRPSGRKQKRAAPRRSAAAHSSSAHERQEASRPGDRAGWPEPTHATRFSRGAGAGR